MKYKWSKLPKVPWYQKLRWFFGIGGPMTEIPILMEYQAAFDNALEVLKDKDNTHE